MMKSPEQIYFHFGRLSLFLGNILYLNNLDTNKITLDFIPHQVHLVDRKHSQSTKPKIQQCFLTFPKLPSPNTLIGSYLSMLIVYDSFLSFWSKQRCDQTFSIETVVMIRSVCCRLWRSNDNLVI